DALVDGLGDLVLAGLDLPDGSGDWRDELRTTARSLNALLTAHPAAREVFRSRPLSTPEALRTADSMLALLRRAGFPPDEAARAAAPPTPPAATTRWPASSSRS